MKLAEIYTQLTHGELSQLAIGGSEQGEINENNYDRILSHVNLALTALFKRFPLKEGRLTLALQPGRYTYPLKQAYAVSNVASTEPVKYILDAGDPFLEDILKVESIFTDAGYELGLNNEADPYAVMTPSASVLRIPAWIVNQGPDLPEELKTTNLEVVYRANHPIITSDASFDPGNFEVELPYSHLEPLLLYIASRLHNPIGMTNEFHTGNSYAAKYELACQALETTNLGVDQGSQPDRITRGGWI